MTPPGKGEAGIFPLPGFQGVNRRYCSINPV